MIYWKGEGHLGALVALPLRQAGGIHAHALCDIAVGFVPPVATPANFIWGCIQPLAMHGLEYVIYLLCNDLCDLFIIQ